MKDIIDKLRELDAKAIKDNVSSHFVEITSAQNEVVIAGNQEGLIYLALQLLLVAEKGYVGSHCHIDEASIADRADVAVVFVLKNPKW